MSDPSDAEWEAAEEARLESQIWDHYRRRELEWEAQREDERADASADRAAKIICTILLIALLVAVMVAAQTELNL